MIHRFCLIFTMSKVVDMGSAELGFFKYLREIPGIRDVVLVDKDGQKMQARKLFEKYCLFSLLNTFCINI